MTEWAGTVFQGAIEFSQFFVPKRVKIAIRSGPIWKRLLALSVSIVIVIVGIIMLIFAGLFVLAVALQFRKPVSSNMLIYENESANSLHDIEHCLLASAGGLNLRKKFTPSSSDPVSRVGNSVRHVVIDIHDKGSSRTIKVYSRGREALYPKEVSAIDRCRV
jgi:hypothetical protein